MTRTIAGISRDAARELDDASHRSFWIQPIRLDHDNENAAGLVVILLNWDAIAEEVMVAAQSSNASATTAGLVVQNTCGDALTYGFHQGSNGTFFVGEGDWHNVSGSGLETVVVPFGPSLFGGVENNINGTKNTCEYSFVFYGSIQSTSTSSSATMAIIFAVTAAVVSLLLTLAFVQYHRYVSKQNGVIEATAKQESALLASLFPTNVAKRLFAEEKQKSLLFFNTKNRVKCYLDEQGDGKVTTNNRKKRKELRINRFVGKPIAELYVWVPPALCATYYTGTDRLTCLSTSPTSRRLNRFPETTILFADISGFTSWSSTRNPEAVLRLLECIYRAFDLIAKAQRVYKVRTASKRLMRLRRGGPLTSMPLCP